MNKAIIFGYITKDPELKTLPSGIPVCSFTVATN
ncbi:MAG: single-stranded DNA-binding protein, partial [Clostridiales bacterium]|nr:single-stranded DNA-binding protein [Clostridiales bacterium]